MQIGVPKEVKESEFRVALVPAGVEELVRRGHEVLVESGAGEGSGFLDDRYEEAGAQLVNGPDDVWGRSTLVLKVKEPLPEEWARIKTGQVLFTYLHLAASDALTTALADSKAICMAYETVQLPSGDLPLLTPMSEVAGRLSVVQGAKYLERFFGGRGVLLGGVPGVMPADVVILGGGTVGTHAARMAAGFGGRVTILDVSLPRLRHLAEVMPANVALLHSNPLNVRNQVRGADVVIGSVLVPGGRAPFLVSREDVAAMRPGSVIVDVSVDQGGCVETIRPTTHQNPVYIEEDVVHYAVSNMPGAVSRTSTLALTNATLPYISKLADRGWQRACREDPALRRGLNLVQGAITHPGVADAFSKPYVDPVSTLGEVEG